MFADHNAYWTAFGPTNVITYRISAAYALGDAGTAIAHAARVPPGTIRIPERTTQTHTTSSYTDGDQPPGTRTRNYGSRVPGGAAGRGWTVSPRG